MFTFLHISYSSFHFSLSLSLLVSFLLVLSQTNANPTGFHFITIIMQTQKHHYQYIFIDSHTHTVLWWSPCLYLLKQHVWEHRTNKREYVKILSTDKRTSNYYLSKKFVTITNGQDIRVNIVVIVTWQQKRSLRNATRVVI